MSNALQRVFEYEGRQVRTVVVDGEPWFVTDSVRSIKHLNLNRHRFVGYVYALEVGGRVKIGMTRSPLARLPKLASSIASLEGGTVGRVLLSQPHTNYAENERAVHEAFADRRLFGEFFNMTLDELIAAMPRLVFKDDSDRLAQEHERKSSRLQMLTKDVFLRPAPDVPVFVLRIGYEIWVHHAFSDDAVSKLAEMDVSEGFSLADADLYLASTKGVRAINLADIASKEGQSA